MTNALLAGALGAATTNLLHETVRRIYPNAPRVDLLGMQALSKLVATQTEPPKGRALYAATLAGDLLSNSAYFSLIGLGPRSHALKIGFAVGTLAGLGAVALPKPLGLSESTTSRTPATAVLTLAMYTLGGLATGFALRA
jgi:hypothetical protein